MSAEIQRLSLKMTKEEGKGQKGKERAGNEAGNRPSAEEEESSKQLVEENEENMQTGTANEAVNKRVRGRPRKQLLVEEMKIRREKKMKSDRDYRAKKKQFQEYEAFCEMPKIYDMFKEFMKIKSESLKKEGMRKEEPELTAYGKRPNEYFMLEHQARKAFCKMPGINDMFKPFNEVFMKINAESLKGITKQAPQLTEYLKRPEKYLMLEHEVHKAFCEMPGINDMFKPFNEEFMKVNAESLKGMAEQEPELTEYFKQPDEYFMSKFFRKWQELFKKLFEEEGTTEKFKAVWLKEHQLPGHCFPERDEPSGTAPPGDHNVANIAANPPQLQIANTGTNNVEQEDNTANQENEAAEAAHNTGIVAAATSGSWYP